MKYASDSSKLHGAIQISYYYYYFIIIIIIIIHPRIPRVKN